MASALMNLNLPSAKESKSPSKSNVTHAMMFMKSVEGGTESVRSSDKKKEESVSFISEMTSKGKFNHSRNKFKRSFLIHEFKTIKRVTDWLTFDLNLVKMYLHGEHVQKLKDHTISVLQSFNVNEVPTCWYKRLGQLNVSIENFSQMIRSLLLKFD